MKKAILLVALAVLFAAANAVAEQNITEVKIESIPVIVDSGTSLDFSFLVGNREGSACNAQTTYWIGEQSLKESQGSDTAYLGQGDVRTGHSSVLVPSDMQGVQNFYLQMECNDTTVLANKTIEVRQAIPIMFQLSQLEIKEDGEGKQLGFSYGIKSNHEGPATVHVEEQLKSNGSIVWSNAQTMAVSGSSEVERLGPMLQAWEYELVVVLRDSSMLGEETVKITKLFKAAKTPINVSLAASVGVLLALAIATGTTIAGFNYLRKHKSLYAPLLRSSLGKQNTMAAKNMLCPVEAGSSGVLEEYEMNTLLDEAGFKGKQKEKAIQFAETTPVTQLVRGCILTDAGRMTCETTVTMSLSNNSNRNWKNIVLLARIPEFLAEKVEEIEADCEMKAVQGTAIIEFGLPKLGAMQTASISYKTARMVSQAEANSVPLPAVAGYRQGKPLKITQVRVEKAEEKEKANETAAFAKSVVKKTRKSKTRKASGKNK